MNDRRRELIKIAVPAILESLVAIIVTAIDTKMISVLGKESISAVSFTSQPKLIFLAVFYALGTALSFFVAQAYGRQDHKEANDYFHVILRITILMSVVFGILLYIFARPVMLLCSRQMETIDISASFFRIIMGFVLFQNLSIVLNSALRGIGRTKVTFYTSIVMAVVDIIFNYLLIEGHFGFPALGVRGDAIATVMGTVAASIVSIVVLVRNSDFLSLKGLFDLKRAIDPEIIRNVKKKASSVVAENIFIRIGFLLSSIIISTFSYEKTAVYSVGMILMGYSFAFGDGLSSATIALCGKSIGAKDIGGFKDYKRIANITGIIIAISLSVIYLAGSDWFFGLYFADEASIKEGFESCIIIAMITLFQILRIVDVGAMRGMGEVDDPRRIASVCVLVLNPALSLLFAYGFKLEIWGVWIASLLTQIIWFAAAFIRCRYHVKKLEAEYAD